MEFNTSVFRKERHSAYCQRRDENTNLTTNHFIYNEILSEGFTVVLVHKVCENKPSSPQLAVDTKM